MAAAVALAAPVEDNDGKLNRLVAAQLQKTKMCAMHQRGTCRDPKCRFAHSLDELREAPNLTKTAMCRMFTRGQCRNSSCKFAHGEQELRVTPTVYKTQLCNFHMRGHCKKGTRCRHAHGDAELRSFLAAQAANSSPPRTPTPTNSDDTQSTATGDRFTSSDGSDASPYRGFDEVGTPYESSQQELRALMSAPPQCWSPGGPPPEWWAAYLAANQTNMATPPPANMGYMPADAQPTPEKAAFPAVPRLPGCNGAAEPMKVELAASPGFVAAPPLGSNALTRPTSPPLGLYAGEAMEPLSRSATPGLTHEDIGIITNAHLAWAAQAKMDYELAAAQLKVQELQAKRHWFAATTHASGLAFPGQESHFDSIMQTLGSRPGSPAGMVQLPARQVTPSPPGLEPATQSWHPTDVSQKHSTAWVI